MSQYNSMKRLYYIAFIECLGALQFGYHLAELNAPEAYISCRLIQDYEGYDCIPMSAEDIGLITSIYSLGGLLAASISGILAGKLGRKKASLLTCIPFTIGPIMMGTATSVLQMQAGRFITGLGAGSAIVIVPLYLNEISPPDLRGKLGFMGQLAINFGILLAQFLGYIFSDYFHWRYILFFGAVIGILNAILLTWVPESPKWLAATGRVDQARRCLQHLRQTLDIEEEFTAYRKPKTSETQRLLEVTEEVREHHKEVSIWSFCTHQKYRKQFIAVCGVMAFQQICGVNSIVFYGVAVLADLLPQLAPLLNCIISTLNCIVTVVSANFVDEHGRKALLVWSIAGMTFTSFLLGFGITHSLSILSAFSATAFVVSFALGLGPVPFMVIPELVPHEVANAAQSVGSTINWLSMFLVGFLFPIIEHNLGGATYYLFTAIGTCGIVFTAYCVPETRGRSTMIEVWGEL